MTHSAADVTRWYLIAAGVGTDPHEAGSWPVFAGHEPAAPDNCITVYDTDGTDDGRNMLTSEVMGHDGVQVRVRAGGPTAHRTGYEKAEAVRSALAAAYEEVVAPADEPERYLVHCYARIGNIIPLGREPSSTRNLFTVNAVTPMRQLS